jgi:hypothetical protein
MHRVILIHSVRCTCWSGLKDTDCFQIALDCTLSYGRLSTPPRPLKLTLSLPLGEVARSLALYLSSTACLSLLYPVQHPCSKRTKTHKAWCCHYLGLARDRRRQPNAYRDMKSSACSDQQAPSPSVWWALLAARLGGTLPIWLGTSPQLPNS